MRNYIAQYYYFTRRSLIVYFLKLPLLASLVYRFFRLQITSYEKFKALSLHNKLCIYFTLPSRGYILTSDRETIAHNKLKYSLILRDCKNLSRIIQEINNIIAPDQINVYRKRIAIDQSGILHVIELINKIDPSYIRVLRVNPNLNNVLVNKEHIRYYPFTSLFFHLVGYVRVLKYASQIRGMQIEGRSGIEKIFNNQLSGISGVERIEVNAHNKFIKRLQTIKSRSGKNIIMSVNLKIQKIVAHVMKNKVGAVMIYDLHKLSIAALYSAPSIDANIFTKKLSQSDWSKISQIENQPFINRAIATLYNPGSTFKIVIYLATLIYNIDPAEKIFCPGCFKFSDHIYHCHKKTGHGLLSLDDALSKSCNIYFYKKSLQLGVDKIGVIADRLGFGLKTGLELSGELSGLIPNQKWKKEQFAQHWYKGDTINTSIGQGYVQVTVIQLLRAISQIALNKKLNMTILSNKEHILNGNLFPENHVARLHKALRNSIKTHFSQKLQIFGKTGTSQVIAQSNNNKKYIYQDHSIFIGFTTKYSIVVLIENGGWGFKTALPLSKIILNKL